MTRAATPAVRLAIIADRNRRVAFATRFRLSRNIGKPNPDSRTRFPPPRPLACGNCRGCVFCLCGQLGNDS